MNFADQIADVIDALKEHGFEFIGLGDDGWLKLQGNLKTSTSDYVCELQIDTKFIELPRIRLLHRPEGLGRLVPHLGSNGHLCYLTKDSVVIDIFDPVGQTLACLQRAAQVLDKVLKGEMIEDLEDEFYVYWGGSLCLLDMQDQLLGNKKTLGVSAQGNIHIVVTDDEFRTNRKLQSLGCEITSLTLQTYRIRTNAKPRPNITTWPPKTVGELLSWQGLLDTRCRRNIERRLEKSMKAKANGVLIIVESPLLTYGFSVLFKRELIVGGVDRFSRSYLYAQEVIPMSVLRIDDRYMAQRNVPGLQTLAGKRIVLIGCGTIGGYLAEMLVKAGAGTSGGELTLLDFDSLLPQNIGRHRLGFSSLFKNKAIGLGEEISFSAPGAAVRVLPVDVKKAQLGKADLLIDATGEESLGHWLCARYLPIFPMLTVWIEGPGTAVRALLRTKTDGACYRCLCDANRKGLLSAVVGGVPAIMAGQGCEGLYVPFPASVSVQAAALASEMALGWVNGEITPALRTRLTDYKFQLATPDCDPPRMGGCPACPS